MAFFACGTRDKLNARPAGATRHLVVASGSLFGTGLIFLDARRSWSLRAWGACLLEVDFWKCLKICFNFSFCTRSFARHFRNVPKCRFGWKVGMRGACGRYGTEGFRVRLVGGRAPLRRFAPCVLRWKTLRVSSAPHPCGFESLRLLTRKRPGLMKARGAQLPWLGRRDSNPQQPAPKTGVLPLNYVPM